ncbi:NhaC Na:H antiporter family protein [Thecamonas trahens ATCC 50062]|uniref:NhaC Na:H antiporter family protein n=1 Tax=Thecamonas trahens ATCC 50062 TaxID=461836 RepID=A0A0L0DM72_THETB|nr:NhaC Na:H antiporter family protein [Thecamonas trahens ATCC 50062]KNC52488.1 NhaC Na:H antiporter family protein [Thecamonas trahens ATCC 50062]|eukprot:XP_013755285.1 NhaC Na:H antiporter family protein [Thecamonas trahens ATCC 50062]
MACLLLASAAWATKTVSCDQGSGMLLPEVMLTHIRVKPQLVLTPYYNNSLWASNLTISQRIHTPSHGWRPWVVGHVATELANGTRVLDHDVPSFVVNSAGMVRLEVIVRAAGSTDSLCGFTTIRRVLPGWVSVLPPMLTTVVAIAFRQVLLALFSGVWLAAFLLNRLDPLEGLLRSADTYWVQAIEGSGHPGVILFTFFLGGCIGIVSKMGGTLGLAKVVTKLTKSSFSAKVCTLAMGLVIFFDDYSSILIVGSTMKPILSRLAVSPAKFAFLIHVMGACLASFAPVSSWVGVEVGYIQTQYEQLGLDGDAFVIFLQTIPYRFFPVLMIVFVWILTLMRRDFGPMLALEEDALAEQEAVSRRRTDSSMSMASSRRGMSINSAKYALRSGEVGGGLGYSTTGDPILVRGLSSNETSMRVGDEPRLLSGASSDSGSGDGAGAGDGGALAPKPGAPQRWFNAAIPFGIIIVVTFVGMYLDGYYTLRGEKNPPPRTLVNIFSNANSIDALLWASLLGTMAALFLALLQCILTLSEAMEAWVEGVKDILEAIIILLLAWALGGVIFDLQTAAFLSEICNGIPVGILPLIITLTAFLMSFATGSAFGTMGILFPLVVPLAYTLSTKSTAHAASNVVLQSVSSVLSGAVFGNVIAPIADNSVLACMVSGADIPLHISSMALYVGIVSVVSLLGGTIPCGLGWYPSWVGLLICTAILIGIVFVFGKVPSVDRGMARISERTALLSGAVAESGGVDFYETDVPQKRRIFCPCWRSK